MNNAEYRNRLKTKLNCLIAVLDVAITKIQRSMDLPGANAERLTKIMSNLENTRSICERALNTLDRVTPAQQQEVFDNKPKQMGMREYVELTSIDEYQKFKTLPPISAEEVADADIDRLIEKL